MGNHAYWLTSGEKNTFNADDYINNYHLVTTKTDAAQNMAGNNLFCQLDCSCSQAYHCFQMADEQSTELLAFNFVSRRFAYWRLARGPIRFVWALSSFIHEYLDPVTKANQCVQYVDDFGIATNTPQQLIKNLRAVFQCRWKPGLKLNIAECHFGLQEVDVLGCTKTIKGVAAQKQKIAKILEKVKIPRSKKALQLYIGFLKLLSKPQTPFDRTTHSVFSITQNNGCQSQKSINPEIMKEFREINEALDRCCQLVLRQLLPRKQLVFMTVASFSAAAYAVLIEDNPNQTYSSTRKTSAPIACG